MEGFTRGSRKTLQESGVYQVTSLVAVAVGFHLTSYIESGFIFEMFCLQMYPVSETTMGSRIQMFTPLTLVLAEEWVLGHGLLLTFFPTRKVLLPCATSSI